MNEHENPLSDMKDIMRRCFAYNVDGKRCSQLAGHAGDHALVIEWTDEECFDPTVNAPAALVEAITSQPSQPAAQVEEGTEKCVLCNHPATAHSEDGCVARQKLEDGFSDGDACGCYTFV